ncbi:MAG: Crp/Fnr family transcriptional regulator [Clostridiales bacterium]|nr:Crp/Fnr family transcriptional regulator [Clostridiales bacterium]
MSYISSQDHPCISNCALLRGVRPEDLNDALEFLDAFEKKYKKNNMIFLIGDPFRYAGIVLNGTVELSFLDEGDNSVNMNHFSAGSVFGESLACAEAAKSPVQMQALTDCRILFLDLKRIIKAESLLPGYQSVIGSNLLQEFARRNVFLNQKIQILSQRKLRDKLRVFFRLQPISADGIIELRFNRSQLSEFLGVNRSALSRELSMMQDDGILLVEGNRIQVLDRHFLLNA